MAWLYKVGFETCWLLFQTTSSCGNLSEQLLHPQISIHSITITLTTLKLNTLGLIPVAVNIFWPEASLVP